jgi:hypothetical protein
LFKHRRRYRQLVNVDPQIAIKVQQRMGSTKEARHRSPINVKLLSREIVPVDQKSAICICVAGSHRCVINQEHTFVAADAHTQRIRMVDQRTFFARRKRSPFAGRLDSIAHRLSLDRYGRGQQHANCQHLNQPICTAKST